MSDIDLMQLFVRAMRARLARLSKATYSTVTLEKDGDAFVLVATWLETKKVPAGSCSVRLDRERVLGATANLPALQQRLVKQPCKVHDEFITEVLRKRGLA